MNFLRKEEQKFDSITGLQKQVVEKIATLEVLREIREGLDKVYLKLSELEKRIDEKNQKNFVEVVDIDEIAKRVAVEVKSIARPIIASREQLSIVESRRIQKIISILQEHGKLSSSQLSKIFGLSRTRANEYFKKMENLGIAEGITIGKEKYYRLKD